MPKKTNIWYEVKKDSAFVEDATAITYDSTIVHRFVIDSLEKGRLVDIRPLSVTGHITTATTLYISFGTDTLEFKISRAPELDSTYTISALKWRKEGDSKENSLWPKAAIGQLMYAGELCFFDNNLELYVDRLSFPKKDLIDTEEKGIDVKKIK